MSDRGDCVQRAEYDARHDELDRRIGRVEDRVDFLTKEVADARVELKGAVTEIKAIKDDLIKSGKRNMWAIGLLLTAANIIIDLVVLVR